MKATRSRTSGLALALVAAVAGVAHGLALPAKAGDTGGGTAMPHVQALADQLACTADFFAVDGCPAFLLRPKGKPERSPMPWVWYAPVIGHPNLSHAWMLRQWLAKGIGMAGVDVGESFGSPRGRAAYTALWQTLATRYRMAERPCLLPQSRGGLMLYNWAAENPTRVACIAGIYTVCDLRSYPGLDRACGAYRMSAAELEARLAEHNPIDRLAPLAKAGVPILHIHGDADAVVPLEKNAGELARRYRALGGKVRLIVIPGKGHQVCPEFFECQELVDFVIARAQAAGAAKQEAWDDLPPVQPEPEDWPWWRGPKLDNIAAAGQDPPLRWSAAENVAWKADVPGRGHASPCLWGDRVFLPTADEKAEVQYVLCYDRRTGRRLWQTEIHRGNFVRIHGKNSHASATPACDGRCVFVPFAVQNAVWLTALDLDGRIVWQQRLGDFRSKHGFAASPLLYGSLVIVAADSVKNSFLAAMHRGSGRMVWKIGRPDYYLGTYASPAVGRVAGRDQLLLHGPYKVFSYDPADGSLLWSCDGPSESSSSTMTFSDTLVWSAVGFPKRNLLCIRGDGNGDITKTHVVWSKKDKMAYVPSLLLAKGLLYMVDDDGRATCFEADSGEVVWQARLDGSFSSSPLLAGAHIYAVNEDGVAYVFKSGRSFELVARNDLGDGGFATPVICGSRIYLRTLHHLYCLGKPHPGEQPVRP